MADADPKGLTDEEVAAACKDADESTKASIGLQLIQIRLAWTLTSLQTGKHKQTSQARHGTYKKETCALLYDDLRLNLSLRLDIRRNLFLHDILSTTAN